MYGAIHYNVLHTVKRRHKHNDINAVRGIKCSIVGIERRYFLNKIKVVGQFASKMDEKTLFLFESFVL